MVLKRLVLYIVSIFDLSQDNLESSLKEATPSVQNADLTPQSPTLTTPTLSANAAIPSSPSSLVTDQLMQPQITTSSSRQDQSPAASPALFPLTTPPPSKAHGEVIPSQKQIHGGVAPASPSPKEIAKVARTRASKESTGTATHPPLVEGVARRDPEAVTPGAGGSGQLSGVLSRLKKRVVDPAWQGAESKVSS